MTNIFCDFGIVDKIITRYVYLLTLYVGCVREGLVASTCSGKTQNSLVYAAVVALVQSE